MLFDLSILINWHRHLARSTNLRPLNTYRTAKKLLSKIGSHYLPPHHSIFRHASLDNVSANFTPMCGYSDYEKSLYLVSIYISVIAKPIDRLPFLVYGLFHLNSIIIAQTTALAKNKTRAALRPADRVSLWEYAWTRNRSSFSAV